MSMFSIFEISGSAMTAQSQRMNVTASNMANADSVAGPDGEAYRAKQVMFEARGQNGTGVGGVGVREVIEDPSPLRREFRPDHPLADADVAADVLHPASGDLADEHESLAVVANEVQVGSILHDALHRADDQFTLFGPIRLRSHSDSTCSL